MTVRTMADLDSKIKVFEKAHQTLVDLQSQTWQHDTVPQWGTQNVHIKFDELVKNPIIFSEIGPTSPRSTKSELAAAFVELQKADCALTNVLVRARLPL